MTSKFISTSKFSPKIVNFDFETVRYGLTVASSFLSVIVASFFGFKIQYPFSGWTTNKSGKLIAWIGHTSPNSYFFEGPHKSMDFRSTSAKTSGKQKFRKKFYWLKKPPSNFMGTLEGSFLHSATLNGLKSRKTPLWILKSKKRRNC